MKKQLISLRSNMGKPIFGYMKSIKRIKYFQIIPSKEWINGIELEKKLPGHEITILPNDSIGVYWIDKETKTVHLIDYKKFL